jgi:hypothetical protein
MLLSATCMKMIGDGTHMIQLKEVTGSAIKMQSTTCVNKPQKQFYNLNLMDYRFQERNKEKFIKERLVDSLETKENVHIFFRFRTSLSNLCSSR